MVMSGVSSELRRRRGLQRTKYSEEPRKDPYSASTSLDGEGFGLSLVVVSSYLAAVALASYGLYWVPTPLQPEGVPQLFSEGRALKHAAYLSEDIGDRRVGTPQVESAAQYVLQEVNTIAEMAKGNPALEAIVDREQTTGGINAEFAGARVTSAYQNLTNIILYIAPSDISSAAMPPAVLLNSHFDSVFGTKGASDCGSCVGVMLEIARVIAANPEIRLAAPLLFLFNGGEETFLLAAHGFMAHSKWASKAGAFINLESTGPGGPAYLFQHTGGWTLKAFSKAAKYPQGSVCGQDFFDSRLLKMDTDFRMFSSQHHGNLPGIDIAYIMDGAAYHTNQDTVERIRKGTVQASGENILAATLEFSRLLAEGVAMLPEENAVFFDVLGRYMVTYSWRLAQFLHTAPLALLILAIAVGQKWATGVTCTGVLTAAGLTLASLPCAVLAPAVFGALRTALTGKSMIWFGNPLLFISIYGPAALAGLLLPFARHRRLPKLPDLLLGVGLAEALIAATLTAFNGRSGFMSAAWAVTCLGAAVAVSFQTQRNLRQVATLLIIAFPASVLTAPFIATLPIFVMEHLSISGAPPAPWGFLVGDTAVGVVMGLAMFVTGAFSALLLAHTSHTRLQAIVTRLLVASTFAAIVGTLTQEPYSKDYPKRVVIQHLHRLGSEGQVIDSRWSLAAMDSIPVTVILPKDSEVLSSEADEWQGLFPISTLIRGVSLPAKGPDPTFLSGSQPPVRLEQVNKEATSASSGTVRLHLELQTVKAAWGTFNMTGSVLGWSFADDLQANYVEEDGTESFMVRFAGNDASWPFWVDIKAGSVLDIKAAILFLDTTADLAAFTAELPAWTNAMPLTGFIAAFKFS